MAEDFVSRLPGFTDLRPSTRRLYQDIMDCLPADYVMPKGKAGEIAEQISVSTATVYRYAKVIRALYMVYTDRRGSGDDRRARVDSLFKGDYKARADFNLLFDPDFDPFVQGTAGSLVDFQALNKSPVQPGDSQTGRNHAQAIRNMVAELEGKFLALDATIAELGAKNDRLSAENDRLSAENKFLREVLGRVKDNVETTSGIMEWAPPNMELKVRDTDAFAKDPKVNLPTEGVLGGARDVAYCYLPNFQKQWFGLDGQQQECARRSIWLLATEGKQKTFSSQHHEKYQPGRGGATSGDTISRYSKSGRFTWRYSQDGGGRYEFTSIGHHTLYWKSEK